MTGGGGIGRCGFCFYLDTVTHKRASRGFHAKEREVNMLQQETTGTASVNTGNELHTSDLDGWDLVEGPHPR
jgi:hypothetical protein